MEMTERFLPKNYLKLLERSKINIKWKIIKIKRLFESWLTLIYLEVALPGQTIAYKTLITDLKMISIYPYFVSVFGVHVPLQNFSLMWRRHHYRWRAANFNLCLALMAIEQWTFFSMLHLLWHRTSVYNGHLQGPVTLTPISERLAVNLSLTVFTT